MYVKQNYSLLFYRKMKKMNSQGMVPIYCRLTIDGLRDEISTGVWINPDHWEPEYKSVTSDDPESDRQNKILSKLETDLERHFQIIQAQEEIATPRMVFEEYQSPMHGQRIQEEKVKNLRLSDDLDKLLADYIDFRNRYDKAYRDGNIPLPPRAEQFQNMKEELHKRIETLVKRGNEIFDNKKWEKTLILATNEHLLYFLSMSAANHRSATTLEKMWGRKRRLLEFMEYRYQIMDIPLSKLDVKFLRQFKLYNVTQRKVIENTAERYIQAIKETINRCVDNGWLVTSMLGGYHCHYEEPKHDWPTLDEMVTLVKWEFSNPNIQETADIFIFSAFTGLAYADFRAASPENIMTGIDGGKWFTKDRQKTDGDETLPLLPIALRIIDKYKNHPVCIKRGRLLPVPTNQEYNRRLKVIQSLTGIRIKLKSHKGRFFFANEVTFSQGVPTKTIGKMLGQKSERSVHTYVHANKTTISNAMSDVRNKLFDPAGNLNGTCQPEEGRGRVISINAR